MKLLYGLPGQYLDVSAVVKGSTSFLIPADDNRRYSIFGVDPVPKVVKHVRIEDDVGSVLILENTRGFLLQQNAEGLYDVSLPFDPATIKDPEEKLRAIHASLMFRYGSLRDEYPEQLMAVRYIKPDARILELGANIGRNSCVIGKLLKDSSKLVSFECSNAIATQLYDNRDMNGMKFHIETAALSKQRLIQQGWNTKPHPVGQHLPAGWTEVPTVSWDAVKDKYPEPFDTLVADCEGALYYILQEEPTLLDTFHTIIMENDYWDLNHKESVDTALRAAGFHVDYTEAGGWGPCQSRFFEVWQK
jgi:FkbM family methyltransferase